MLNMVLPITIAVIGYFLANIGSNINMQTLKVIGGILIVVAALWFIYNTSFNIGYMLA